MFIKMWWLIVMNSGQIDGDQGILSHPMEHLTQGVVRNRKATFHVPLNVEMNTDIGKLQMDFTYATPKRIFKSLLCYLGLSIAVS